MINALQLLICMPDFRNSLLKLKTEDHNILSILCTLIKQCNYLSKERVGDPRELLEYIKDYDTGEHRGCVDVFFWYLIEAINEEIIKKKNSIECNVMKTLKKTGFEC